MYSEPARIGSKSTMVGFILFVSFTLTSLTTVLASPPVNGSLCRENEERSCQKICSETCLNLYAGIDCMIPPETPCITSCYCKPGFLRIGEKGPCVPRDQCNPYECVNDENAHRGCGDKCGKTCGDYKSASACPKANCTTNGCDCKDGYIYDTNLRLCVKPENCTVPCKPNEWYSTCLARECQPETCDDLGKPQACPPFSTDPCPGGGGCTCRYGYVKDKDGKCIDAKTCPSCGGDPNAETGCGNPCSKTCASLYKNETDPECPYCESNGCHCKDGYFLNTDIKPPRCVLAKDCPQHSLCPENEERSCKKICSETCLNLYAGIDCMIPPEAPCITGCYCKPGFLRIGEKGPCVPRDQCNPYECVNDENAHRGCGDKCGKTCGDYKSASACPKANCTTNGCDCKDGYIYDTNLRLCVKPENCTVPCKPNEWYSTCLARECQPETCDDLGKPQACPPPSTDPCPGGGGCTCRYGYVKDKDGKCIDAKTCHGMQSTPSPPVCPKNEERTCRNPCPPETCLTLYAAFDCIQNQTCVNACHCKKGFLRIGQKGPCVAKDQCNPLECVNDPNAQRGCGDKCGKTCADYKTNPICPKRPCKNDGCECKEGYIYDQNLSLCVKPKDCTKPCKANERYSTCLISECEAKTCDDLGKPLGCPAIAADPCPGGCVCDYGYVKDKDGKCIDAKTCPSCGGDPNAQKGCGNPCGKTCASLNVNKSDIVCPQYCESNGCDCKEGYLLNTDVKPPRCVLVKDCPKPPNKCLKNEESYCGPSCPGSEPSCSNPNPPTCINKRCEIKCFCKKGFVRDANNTCIPANKCPKQCTKPHERYSNCVLGECVPKKCDDLGQSLPCPDIAPPCAGGCLCEKGYVRDKDGNCIDAKKCPSCGGDPNAQAGCGNPCGYTCASLRTNSRSKRDTSAVACATYCEVNGCDCKKGYILNTDVKPAKCVLPADCNKPVNCTKPHERYIDCVAGQCFPKNCNDLGNPISCPSFRSGPCPGGCLCEGGYVYNSTGSCIRLEDCPPKPCGKNETWMTPCDSPCPYPICPRDDKPPPPCVEIFPCYPGCQCKLNYLRNATRQCILAPDCPPVNCTRQNEVWNKCPSACLAESCGDVNKQPTTCNTLVWQCSPRCVCKKGHFRNKDGLCVPPSQCAISKCPKANEEYIECLAGHCLPKTCDELITPAPCRSVPPPSPCPGGCICVYGYVRNSAGECIKKEDCPKNCTGANELHSDCANLQCFPRTCKEVVKMPSCPSTGPACTEGCVCKRGFVRSDNRTCIAIKDCPEAGTCADPNQAWVDCAVNCGISFCPKNDQPLLPCFLPAGVCQPGCKCKPNFRVDNNNNCIPARDCPPVACTSRPNEEYNSCPGSRITSCALLGTKPVPNTGPKICNPACICKEGFYKNNNGTCVTKCECPPSNY